MKGQVTLAHLSDIHLPPPRPYRGHLHAKRLLGMINWHRQRRRQHLRSTLADIVADVLTQGPDHIAITGDLVNVGLPVEHEAAMHWLGSLGPPSQVTAVPGNHDIYVDMASELGVGRWQSFMADDVPVAAKEPYPFVRRVRHLALIGLNSALPTPIFHAYGRLGPGQLERLGEVLERLGAERVVRVVLIHHPPLPGLARIRSALRDAEAFVRVLRRHGAELILHGHNHRATTTFTAGPDRPIPVVGVPSASLGLAYRSQSLARYNLYQVEAEPGAPIELIERGLVVPMGPVAEIGRQTLVSTPQPVT